MFNKLTLYEKVKKWNIIGVTSPIFGQTRMDSTFASIKKLSIFLLNHALFDIKYQMHAVKPF